MTGAIVENRQSADRASAWRGYALVSPAYLWLLLAVFLPLSAMVYFSFLSSNVFDSGSAQFTLGNYLSFIRRPVYPILLWRSVLLGIIVTALCCFIGLFAGLALARALPGRARALVFMLILLPFWTSGLVRVFSWVVVLRTGGVLDSFVNWLVPGAGPTGILYTYTAIVIGLVHAYLPYMIITCYLSALAIDDSILDAARSLGATWPRVFRRVVLPLMLPGLGVGAVLTFVPVVGSFMEPRLLGGRSGTVFGTIIEDQFTAVFNWPLGAALSFIMLAVVLVIMAISAPLLRDRREMLK
ncbi:MAG: ABC transporter permease [Rhizobiales bacterium]|nr:ABC transporter permease [Hyphomicrobiales bacterium]